MMKRLSKLSPRAQRYILCGLIMFPLTVFPIASWAVDSRVVNNQAMKCTPTDWNIALKAQKKSDVRYNALAVRFNQILEHHQGHTLLHQKFSPQELQSLWRADHNDRPIPIRTQLKHARDTVKQTDTELDKISHSLSLIHDTREKWQSISLNCQQQENMINMITSQHYVGMNQQIIDDIEQLKKKLLILKQQYLNEIAAIEQSYPD